MPNLARIHANKIPVRIHYIAEWADHRGLRQVDVVTALDVDKGVVSKWFKGGMPDRGNLVRLAALFELEEPGNLFRHPHDDWLTKYLRGRKEDELKRMVDTLKAAFPPADQDREAG